MSVEGGGAVGVAGGVGADASARARTLAAEGRAAVEAGDAETALARFRAAYDLSHDAVLLADIGMAQKMKGDLAAAWRSLQRYRIEASAMYAASPARVDAAMTEIEPRLGGVMIEAEAPSGEVWLDGHLVARLPMERPVYLAAGDASLTVRIPGRGQTEVEADVEIGAVARVEADLDDLEPIADVGAAVGGVAGGVAGGVGGALGGLGGGADVDTPDVDSPDVCLGADPDLDPDVDADSGGLSPWFWVAGIVGAVVVVGAIVATVVHGNLSSDFDVMGCGGATPGPMCESLDADVGLASGLQIGGFVLGGVALVGAGLIFALSGSASADEEIDLDCPTPASPSLVAAVRPTIGPHGGGASFTLQF